MSAPVTGSGVTRQGSNVETTLSELAFTMMGLNYGQMMDLADGLTHIINNHPDQNLDKKITALALWNWAVIQNVEGGSK